MAFELIAVTNRTLCAEPLELRIAALCDAGVDRVIIREKDLTEREFTALLDRVDAILAPDQERLITINSFVDIAGKRGFNSIQVSFAEFAEHTDLVREFQDVGVSVHSLVEAKHAALKDADYLIAGNIFETQCKPGLEGRGLEFLTNIAGEVSMPVYAIGGINASNIQAVQAAGAQGACLMSTLMSCSDVAAEVARLRAALA